MNKEPIEQAKTYTRKALEYLNNTEKLDYCSALKFSVGEAICNLETAITILRNMENGRTPILINLP